jgi:hypothetical protein
VSRAKTKSDLRKQFDSQREERVRSTVFQLRLSPSEREALEAVAAAHDLGLASLIRQLVVREHNKLLAKGKGA